MSIKMNGILVAADITVEWMLPWWLEHYRKHNSYPVAFIDLGMSFEQKKWCKKQGQYIALRVVDFASEKMDIDPALSKQWEKLTGKHFWDSRNAWFKKPLACLRSPFDRTIWLDVDCEVRGSIDSLFDYSFALAKDPLQPFHFPMFNSGVMAFHQNHPLLKNWAEHCNRLHGRFRSDQEVLSWLIAQKKEEITILPPRFNWCYPEKDGPEIVIYHWAGKRGKSIVKYQIASSNWV